MVLSELIISHHTHREMSSHILYKIHELRKYVVIRLPASDMWAVFHLCHYI